jgi:hypothetical protein
MKTPRLTDAQRAELLGDVPAESAAGPARPWFRPHFFDHGSSEHGATVAEAIEMLSRATEVFATVRISASCTVTTLVDAETMRISIELDVEIEVISPNTRVDIQLREDGWAWIGRCNVDRGCPR